VARTRAWESSLISNIAQFRKWVYSFFSTSVVETDGTRLARIGVSLGSFTAPGAYLDCVERSVR